jgi:hypothetical protein
LSFWYDGPKPRRDKWTANYPLSVESRDWDNRTVTLTARVVIEGVETDECPKSKLLQSPSSDELVQLFIENVGGGFGAPDSWPGNFYDAFHILKNQAARDSNERDRAIRNL